jgi:hypothetical protein
MFKWLGAGISDWRFLVDFGFLEGTKLFVFRPLLAPEEEVCSVAPCS